MVGHSTMRRAAALLIIVLCGCLHLVLDTALQSAGPGEFAAPTSAGSIQLSDSGALRSSSEERKSAQESSKHLTVRASSRVANPKEVKAPDTPTRSAFTAGVSTIAFPRRVGGLVHAISRRTTGNIPAILQVFRC